MCSWKQIWPLRGYMIIINMIQLLSLSLTFIITTPPNLLDFIKNKIKRFRKESVLISYQKWKEGWVMSSYSFFPITPLGGKKASNCEKSLVWIWNWFWNWFLNLDISKNVVRPHYLPHSIRAQMYVDSQSFYIYIYLSITIHYK